MGSDRERSTGKGRSAAPRLERDLSQGELAERAAVARRTIQRLDAGGWLHTQPSLGALLRIALVLEIPLEELIEDVWLKAAARRIGEPDADADELRLRLGLEH